MLNHVEMYKAVRPLIELHLTGGGIIEIEVLGFQAQRIETEAIA